MVGWMHGWVDRKMDAWVGGYKMDGWMHGWIHDLGTILPSYMVPSSITLESDKSPDAISKQETLSPEVWLKLCSSFPCC